MLCRVPSRRLGQLGFSKNVKNVKKKIVPSSKQRQPSVASSEERNRSLDVRQKPQFLKIIFYECRCQHLRALKWELDQKGMNTGRVEDGGGGWTEEGKPPRNQAVVGGKKKKRIVPNRSQRGGAHF